MPDIFISYSRDDRERVRHIANALEVAGHDVWWDPEIPPGESFANVIDQNLKDAACIIVAWSKSSINSNWVQEEADDGMMRKTLIPVMIDEIDLPRGFKRLQTADLRGWSGDLEDPNWQLVFAQVDKLVSARKASEAAEEQAAARERAAQARQQTAARQPAQAAQPRKAAAPKQRASAAPAKQEKSGGLPIIPIIAGLFVIGAGSFGYYFMTKGGDEPITKTAAAKDPITEAVNDRVDTALAEAAEEITAADAGAGEEAAVAIDDADNSMGIDAAETPDGESPETAPTDNSSEPDAGDDDSTVADAETAEDVAEEETLPAYAAGEKFRDCDNCPEILVIASTESFTFGADGSRDRAEAPEVAVTISAPFAIGVYEITYDDWQVCLDDGGCNGYEPPDMGWGAGQRPVVNVSHEDANAYLSWLSEKTGETYRLPSEAEWEYAAQAGSDEEFSTGDDITASQANFNGDFPFGGGPKELNRGRTVEVGTFAANPNGLFDVHGNVWEWVADCWKPNYAGAPTDGSAVGGACSSRVIKGGAFTAGAWRSRARHRRSEPQTRRDFDTGFRVLREL
ncbi:MAG: SUMF1/EgtB/PvdO family nonheme iron enzyme [Marinicaulis sp.]|nr:SUMF1/EgtB/PvdO family nonheme iron enzyme [Marinicaulis sp.]